MNISIKAENNSLDGLPQICQELPSPAGFLNFIESDGEEEKRNAVRVGWKNRSKFTKDEDRLLKQLVSKYGESNWNFIAESMSGRNSRQVKERWCNYLSPSLNKSKWKSSEDSLLLKKVSDIGKKWVAISKYFHNRTDQMLKNRYNVLMRLHKRSSDADDETSEDFSDHEEIIIQPVRTRRASRQAILIEDNSTSSCQSNSLVQNASESSPQQQNVIDSLQAGQSNQAINVHNHNQNSFQETLFSQDDEAMFDFGKLFDEADFNAYFFLLYERFTSWSPQRFVGTIP
ncbi:hypothetical protein TRFO_14657 [Tritrichomonas foetus]|uniref:Myb-like DNA-binding domain containing protein n=1 Tax=Tritrichomonas foetus TaxID=1144522 RepID=A0A1J4KV21_9EUKA|nr:hypothetical protein TRFO_14657 [Tritrichomonas foetus]|eukprot:OHT14986.1 hypothetical protein TRFO_14657 [Tritrichomonas foetus]